MKIIAGKYKEERNWKPYVTFNTPDDSKISLVFLWRLAAFCRDYKVKSTLTIGFRSTEKQKYLYDLYKAGKGNPAAPPNSSWHETSLAVDMRSAAQNGWFMKFSNKKLMPVTALKQVLNAYGLMAPLNKVEKAASQVEWWHWQPVETYKFAGDRMHFLDADDAINGSPQTVKLNSKGVWVMELQRYFKQAETGVFDSKLDTVIRTHQREKGLVIDGIFGKASWAKIGY